MQCMQDACPYLQGPVTGGSQGEASTLFRRKIKVSKIALSANLGLGPCVSAANVSGTSRDEALDCIARANQLGVHASVVMPFCD